MLPYIEARQVKAEGVDAAQEPADVKEAGIGALVGEEARGDELHIVTELADALVAVGAALISEAQPLADLREKHAIGHAIVASGSEAARTGRQRHVILYPLRELR